MQKRPIVVRNRAGIHCRPSSVIMNAIQKEFPEERFELVVDGETIELNSILGLIALGLRSGTSAELVVEGPDEAAACRKVGDLFEFEFDFESQ